MTTLLAFDPVMAAPVGFFGMIASFWCCGGVLVIGQFAIFIIAIVQILSRTMPTDAKLLWGAVAWFLPILGPILWWTIGSKQNPPRSTPPSAPPPL